MMEKQDLKNIEKELKESKNYFMIQAKLLKELLKEQETRLHDLTYGYINLESYEKLIVQKREIDNSLRKIKKDWWDERIQLQHACASDIKGLKEDIAHKGELNPLDY